MRLSIILSVLIIALLFPFALSSNATEENVKGDWHTDREKALAAAQKAKKPILAVAIDHA